ncbi:hypothetical protein LXA43DRAFT_1115823 [Ganoderma leucocontextum]|nr:hypothetical protein LXA43DRAFT_1115823 [Ganoderma leucocontextum]
MHNSITLSVWLIESNRDVHIKTLPLTSTRDATIHQFIHQVAKDRKVSIPNLQLWKPREFLMKTDKARRALIAKLEESDWELDKFCDDLSVRGYDALDTLFDGRGWGFSNSRWTICIWRKRSAAPVEIYHPVFAAFAANVKNESLEVPGDVVRSTAEFMTSVSKISTSESPRRGIRTRARADLSNLISATIIQVPNSSNSTATDHIVLHFRRSAPFVLPAALAIVEEKDELGFGGEPSVQGSFAYVDFWTEKRRAALAAACFCPSFIIAIAGAPGWPSAAPFSPLDRSCSVRPTKYIWLGHSRAADDHRTLTLARVFYSLRLAIDGLRTYYDELARNVSRDPVGDQFYRFFQLATPFPLDDQGQTRRVRFRYLRPVLTGTDPSRVAFLVETCGDDDDDGGGGRLLVVKFAKRYGAEAHQLLARHGFAPELLHCGPIWPANEEKYKYKYKHLAGPGEGRVPPSVRARVLEALEVLPGQNLVHGDIRRPNIVIAACGSEDVDAGQRAKIIDFDWAGLEGVVRYPLHLPNAGWVEGVEDYGLIRAAHDRGMAERL